jgi:membrane dipeptidase
LRPQLASTPNIRALVDVIGVDHVCIGTDTKLTQPSPRPNGPGPAGGPQRPRVGERTNQAWQDQTTGFYYAVVDALLKIGFTPDEIGRIGGGNFLRVFGEALKK